MIHVVCQLFLKTNEVNSWHSIQENSNISIHNPQATEYRGRGLFLNLKLDPSPLCLKELQRNNSLRKIPFICAQIGFTEKRKEKK